MGFLAQLRTDVHEALALEVSQVRHGLADPLFRIRVQSGSELLENWFQSIAFDAQIDFQRRGG